MVMAQTIKLDEKYKLHHELMSNLLDDFEIEDIEGSHGDAFDGIYCGVGKHQKNAPFAFLIQDFSYKGGSVGTLHADQFGATIALAIARKIPLLLFLETGGARLQDGIMAIHHSTSIVSGISKASGYIPTISIVKGVCAALGAYVASMSDFAIFVEDGTVFLTGPKVIKSALGKSVDKISIGGSKVHAEKTGIATNVAADSESMQMLLRKYFKLLSNNPKPVSIDAKNLDCNPAISHILPRDNRSTYDMQSIINSIIDKDSSLPFADAYAKNLITQFASLNGTTIGIVANQPKYLSGCIEVKATSKLSRFIQVCDAYDIPMLFLVDCPGILPGEQQEHLGSVNLNTKTAHILLNSSNIKITVIIRRLIGGTYAIMNTKFMSADYVLAWPTAEFGIMSKKASSEVSSTICNKVNLEMIKEAQIVDEIIEPSESKAAIVQAINAAAKAKPKSRLKKKRIVLPM